MQRAIFFLLENLALQLRLRQRCQPLWIAITWHQLFRLRKRRTVSLHCGCLREFCMTSFSCRAWYGMEDGIKWNRNFGMEYGRCQNRMEWKILRMEWKAIFHTNSMLDFAHSIYRKISTDSDS